MLSNPQLKEISELLDTAVSLNSSWKQDTFWQEWKDKAVDEANFIWNLPDVDEETKCSWITYLYLNIVNAIATNTAPEKDNIEYQVSQFLQKHKCHVDIEDPYCQRMPALAAIRLIFSAVSYKDSDIELKKALSAAFEDRLENTEGVPLPKSIEGYMSTALKQFKIGLN